MRAVCGVSTCIFNISLFKFNVHGDNIKSFFFGFQQLYNLETSYIITVTQLSIKVNILTRPVSLNLSFKTFVGLSI